MNEVEELLDAYLRLEERAAGLRTEEKTVRIGSVYPLAPGTIPRMLREFGATFPFIIYNRLTPEIAEGLQTGKYDIGFCSDLLKSEDLEYYPIRGSYIARRKYGIRSEQEDAFFQYWRKRAADDLNSGQK